MLVAVLILLWLISIAVFISDPKSESNRWFSFIVFWVGMGTLRPIIKSMVIPYLVANHPLVDAGLYMHCSAVFMVLSMLFTPYCVLMLGITHSNSVKWLKSKNKLAVIFLIPILGILGLYLINPNSIMVTPGDPLSANSILLQGLLAFWINFNIYLANYLLLSSYITAGNMRLKQERLQIFMFFMPPSILAAYIFTIAPLTGFLNSNPFRYFILYYFLAVFGFFAVRIIVSGVRIVIEKQQLTNTMRTTFSGTAMLNQVIKSEVLKIDICMNNLIHYSRITNPVVNELLQTIQAANSHLLALFNRIHNHIQDVSLLETPTDLLELVDQSLQLITPQLQAKNIKVTKDYCLAAVQVLCDGVHIREVLRNIALNAIEAMKPCDRLHIQIYKKNKRIMIAVTDNGAGISKKDLPHIMKPFFSTKNRQQNCGLGLTYSYNVMQKHGGTLEVFSVKDIGTTVFLSFPPSKVLTATLLLNHWISA